MGLYWYVCLVWCHVVCVMCLPFYPQVVNDPPSIQWFRDLSRIGHGNSSSYVVQREDVGHRIHVCYAVQGTWGTWQEMLESGVVRSDRPEVRGARIAGEFKVGKRLHLEREVDGLEARRTIKWYRMAPEGGEHDKMSVASDTSHLQLEADDCGCLIAADYTPIGETGVPSDTFRVTTSDRIQPGEPTAAAHGILGELVVGNEIIADVEVCFWQCLMCPCPKTSVFGNAKCSPCPKTSVVVPKNECFWPMQSVRPAQKPALLSPKTSVFGQCKVFVLPKNQLCCPQKRVFLANAKCSPCPKTSVVVPKNECFWPMQSVRPAQKPALLSAKTSVFGQCKVFALPKNQCCCPQKRVFLANAKCSPCPKTSVVVPKNECFWPMQSAPQK